MTSEDLGRDLISVNNLIKKHAVCQSTSLSLHLSVCLSVCQTYLLSFTIIIYNYHSYCYHHPNTTYYDTCTIHSVVHTHSNSYHQYTLPYSCTHIHSFTNSPINPQLLSPLTSLQLLENDIQAQQGRIDDIMAQVRRFREANHFQSDQIEDRGRELVAK